MQSFKIIFVCFFLVSCSNNINEERVAFVYSLFSGSEQSQYFGRITEMFPISTLEKSDSPLVFKNAPLVDLPATFAFNGNQIDVEKYLSRSDTSALLILQDGEITYENYWLTGRKDQPWLSMSVSKSFISALIGIAIDQGYIRSVEDDVTDYVSSLKQSSYDGVRIKDILQMSSGASWNENYSDPNADIFRSAEIMAIGGSLDDLAASLKKDFLPGSFNRYNSTDTQVLGMLLRDATGMPVTEYMQKMLWDPIGAEYNGYWVLDSENMEMAYGGLNATARDYAKIGELYRLRGKLNGKQIVPSSWVEDSLLTDAPHLMPGENPLSDYPMGYGYQWWIPDLSGDFLAIGVYNQFIYISPKNNLVVVKLSANSAYGTSEEVSTLSEFEAIEFFKSIAHQ